MIQFSIDMDKSILRAVLIGPADKKEVADFIMEYYPKITFAVLWDISRGDLTPIKKNDFKNLLKLIDRTASHKATAYVYANQEQFGLLRMYTTLAEIERVSPSMKLFETLENAEIWLNELYYKYPLNKMTEKGNGLIPIHLTG